jgi:methanogenic corrinoid protein MtbC1
VYRRTASLFALKRKDLPADAVKDIVCRLGRVAQKRSDFIAPDISEANITAFCDALVNPDPLPSLQFIEARRAEGLTRPGVYLGYIGIAARRLGEGWNEDRLTSLQVTCATGHLYAVMRALQSAQPFSSRPAEHRRFVLFATILGEDHGIGITMAAGLLRDHGWNVTLKTNTDHNALVAHVEDTQPQIIGLSLSSERRLDALVRLVVAIRTTVAHAIIGFAPVMTLLKNAFQIWSISTLCSMMRGLLALNWIISFGCNADLTCH